MTLPYYKGSKLRGILGHALKTACCKLRKPSADCERCGERIICDYGQLFNGEYKDKAALPPQYRKYQNFPPPFSICPPLNTGTSFCEGDYFTFDFNLIGSGINHYHYFLDAFRRFRYYIADKETGARFSLQAIVDNSNGKAIWSKGNIRRPGPVKPGPVIKKGDEFKLEFITPTRIFKYGKPVMNDLDTEILTSRIYEKSALQLFLYCGIDEPEGIGSDSFEVLESDLKWVKTAHSSARHGEKLKMDGFTGTVRVKLNDENAVKYLQTARFMHIGQYTSAGFGKFIIFK